MEPTFEQLLAAMQGRSPAGEKQLPLMLAPNILNSPDPRAEFIRQGQMKVAAPEVMGPPAPPQLPTMTPAAKAALKKRVAPKAPAAPAGPRSMSEKVAAEQAAAKRPGQDLSRGQDNEQKDNFARQDNEPYTYTTREITGVEPPDEDPTAFGDRMTQTHIGFEKDENGNLILKNGRPVPKFHPLMKGAIGPSLRALKSQLPDYQAASRGIADNAELRAKLAPYMSGQMSLAPLLSFINSKQGTNLQDAPDTAAAHGAMLLKGDADAQDNRTKLAALENKLIDQVSIPKGTVFNMGGTTTIKETAKADTPPPIKAAGKTGPNQKDIDAYNKMTAGGSALLNLVQRQKDILKTIPDDYNHSLGSSLVNKLKYAASDVVGDQVLDPYQKKLDAARSTMIQQVNSSVGLHRWNQEEVKSLKAMLGIGQTATKEKVLEGLNYINSLEQQAYLDAEAAHPEGAAFMQGKGRPGSKHFHQLDDGEIKSGILESAPKSKLSPEKEARRQELLKKAGGN